MKRILLSISLALILTLVSLSFAGCGTLLGIAKDLAIDAILDAAANPTQEETPYLVEDGIVFQYFEAEDDQAAYYTVIGLEDGSEITDLVIPAEIDGIPVTEIRYHAFAQCTILRSVEVPDSITCIGSGAFSDCTSLTSITLPFLGESRTSSIRHFGYIFDAMNAAYHYKTIPDSLAAVTITDDIEIPSRAFYQCSDLTSITLPDSVTSIGTEAFRGCRNLTSLSIPSAVTSISAYSFAECSALTEVVIPDGVQSIGTYAFYNCQKLEPISLPVSITLIREQAFGLCKALTHLDYCGPFSEWFLVTKEPGWASGSGLRWVSCSDRSILY